MHFDCSSISCDCLTNHDRSCLILYSTAAFCAAYICTVRVAKEAAYLMRHLRIRGHLSTTFNLWIETAVPSTENSFLVPLSRNGDLPLYPKPLLLRTRATCFHKGICSLYTHAACRTGQMTCAIRRCPDSATEIHVDSQIQTQLTE